MKNFTLGVVFALLTITIVSLKFPPTLPDPIVEHLPCVVLQDRQEFSEQALIVYLTELRIPHPHIVLAQARLETGNFTSTIFKESNNIFGMKRAYRRPSTAIGTHRNHAKYNHWKDSVLDFALYKAYVAQNKDEVQYMALLGNSYAEDPNYTRKVRRIVLETKNYFEIQ